MSATYFSVIVVLMTTMTIFITVKSRKIVANEIKSGVRCFILINIFMIVSYIIHIVLDCIIFNMYNRLKNKGKCD